MGQFGAHKPFSLAVKLVDNIQYVSFNQLSFMSYGTQWKHVSSAATQRCHVLMMSLWHMLINSIISTLGVTIKRVFFICTNVSAHGRGLFNDQLYQSFRHNLLYYS